MPVYGDIMKENTLNKKISARKAVVIIIAVIAVCLAAVTAGVAGHTAYLENQKAFIINDEELSVSAPNSLTYFYQDGVKSVDLEKVIKVSKGASFTVEKLKDEDGSVVKPDGKNVDVSVKLQRQAQVKVVSKSGKSTNDYLITVAPKSAENNVISYNVGDGNLDLDGAALNYSGLCDITLPTPVKRFTGASGNTVNFEFQGWYTTASYEEGTEISVLPKGTSGEIELYAKFATHTVSKGADGYTYIYFGSYPQTQVTSYETLQQMRLSSDYINASTDGGRFTFNGKEYVKFAPANAPNVSDNGYSSNATYVFEVNPVEWRVLKPKNYTLKNGENYDLLATSVLNCASYGEDAGAIQNKYNEYASKLKTDLTTFIRYYFHSDSAYFKSVVKKSVDAMYDEIFTDPTDISKTVERGDFTNYKMPTDNSNDQYSCKLWLLNYSEAISADYGFDTDYTSNDPLRKALVTDFGAANGVYRATSLSHKGQGSWWLRGAGDYPDNGKDAANGDKAQGYNFRAKRIGYVKYTGYVHTFTSLNMKVRSGIRPAVRITYDSSYFTAA